MCPPLPQPSTLLLLLPAASSNWCSHILESCLSAAPSAKETLTAINYHAGWTKGHSSTPLPPNPPPPHTHTGLLLPPSTHETLRNTTWPPLVFMLFDKWSLNVLSSVEDVVQSAFSPVQRLLRAGRPSKGACTHNFFFFFLKKSLWWIKSPTECGSIYNKKKSHCYVNPCYLISHLSHINCDYEPQQIRATVDTVWPGQNTLAAAH